MSEDTYSPEQIETGRLLFAAPVEFVRGAVDLRGLPSADFPEIAFAGRSNVGKSSLINGLLNRKNLARSSNEPGRTRELNYFNLNDQLFLVDLPGYGYARAPKTEIARWTKLTLNYLRGRPTLRRVFMLIDSRRGVMDTDEDVMDLLDTSAVVYQIILTMTTSSRRRNATAFPKPYSTVSKSVRPSTRLFWKPQVRPGQACPSSGLKLRRSARKNL